MDKEYKLLKHRVKEQGVGSPTGARTPLTPRRGRVNTEASTDIRMHVHDASYRPKIQPQSPKSVAGLDKVTEAESSQRMRYRQC